MEKKLQRIEQEKMIAGVCTGLAEYFDVDITWIRIAFVVAVMAGASGILAYIVLWIAVPKRPYLPDYSQFNVDYKVAEPVNISNPGFSNKKKGNGNGRLIAGSIFIFFGTFFLLNEFDLIPHWVEFQNLWPMILIVMGLFTLANARKKEPWNENWTQTNGFNQSSTVNSAEPLTSTESAVEPTEVSNTNSDPKQN
jgi:phage shock protein PspC (stress-responsive transcriptional regulator)